MAGKQCVVYKAVMEENEDQFNAWLASSTGEHGNVAFNLVGGASSSVTYAGRSVSGLWQPLSQELLEQYSSAEQNCPPRFCSSPLLSHTHTHLARPLSAARRRHRQAARPLLQLRLRVHR